MKTAESYFVSEIKQIFNDVIDNLGGVSAQSLSELCVRYEGLGWFIECFALPEDGPNYSPRVAIGLLPELGILARDKQVDIMHCVPFGSLLSRYNLLWRYDDQRKMREVYYKVRDEIFIPFAVPLLRDQLALEALIRERARFLDVQWKNESEGHHTSIIRRRATNAWKEKDFSTFLTEMDSLPSNLISKLDAQRIAHARKNNASP